MVLSETALLLGFPRGLRGLYGLLSEVGEVPPLYPERSILHVAFHQLWLHLTGELAAVLSLVVGILGQDDRRVFVAQRRVLEVHHCLLFAFSGFVPSGILGALLRARTAAGDGGEGERDEAHAKQPESCSPFRMARSRTFDVLPQGCLTILSKTGSSQGRLFVAPNTARACAGYILATMTCLGPCCRHLADPA